MHMDPYIRLQEVELTHMRPIERIVNTVLWLMSWMTAMESMHPIIYDSTTETVESIDHFTIHCHVHRIHESTSEAITFLLPRAFLHTGRIMCLREYCGVGSANGLLSIRHCPENNPIAQYHPPPHHPSLQSK